MSGRDIVVIGASVGCVSALREVVPALPGGQTTLCAAPQSAALNG